MATGVCTYQISGMVQMQGSEVVEPACSGAHGSVHAQETHLRYADGSVYLPFGTTVYALLHQEQNCVLQTYQTLAESPFNKIRFCVFPKDFIFNKNEPELFAFERNSDGSFCIKHPDMDFWDKMDDCLIRLNEMGIEADLILFHPYDRWGFAKLSREQCFDYLEYAVRRLAAFPNIWWSLANEYDQMHAFEPERWKEFSAFLQDCDPWKHMTSNHNFVIPWDFADSNTTHVCLQQAADRKIPGLLRKYGKPVLYDEMGYEGNIPCSWGNLSPFEMVNRFWKVVSFGGYATHGETYMDHYDDGQVLWWSKGGVLKGKSVERIAFLRALLEELPKPMTLLVADRDRFSTKEELRELLTQYPEAVDEVVVQCMLKMNEQQFEQMTEFLAQPVIHYGEEAYLTYYGNECTAYGSLQLPETGNYRVEIIDVWEMTRTVAAENANGKVEVILPGKEGIALLAVRQ